ncbi:unnamed protein product [Miscanthus lutarioriparius]|uniref:TF-B3 domain-containing protein n=1 Tax=Miscanthus lutarioriparius TaxID=422564 RepID=A0A811RB96_9POAL|nr:unnamed protein product [Miscanthus lutarioriparius]
MGADAVHDEARVKDGSWAAGGLSFLAKLVGWWPVETCCCTVTSGSVEIATPRKKETQGKANNTPHFEVYLFNTFCHSMDFPPIDEIVGDSRWVVIKTEHDRYFKFYMVQKDGYFLLHRGWELLMASENLEEQQMVMFEMETQDSFYIWNNDTS